MENAGPGEGFLAEVTENWEACALKAKQSGVRTATMRFAVVLSKAGGLVAKLFPIFFLGTIIFNYHHYHYIIIHYRIN